jgi:hypothetical protein
VENEHLSKRLPDGHARIQGRVWVLEDDLQLLATLSQRAGVPRINLLSGEEHFPGRRLLQEQYAPARCRFSAAALAHQRQRLSAPHLK